MPFEPGQSGNPNGRPTKEEQALRGLTDSELRATLRTLKPASAKALKLIVAAMEDETIPKASRLKHAKEVFDMYIKALQVDKALKKAGESSEPDEDQPEPVVFQIVR